MTYKEWLPGIGVSIGATVILFTTLFAMHTLVNAVQANSISVSQDSGDYQWKVWTCPDTQSDIEKTLKEMEKWLKEHKDHFVEVSEPKFVAGYQFHALIRYRLKQ